MNGQFEFIVGTEQSTDYFLAGAYSVPILTQFYLFLSVLRLINLFPADAWFFTLTRSYTILYT
jgi:hypothetical protein